MSLYRLTKCFWLCVLNCAILLSCENLIIPSDRMHLKTIATTINRVRRSLDANINHNQSEKKGFDDDDKLIEFNGEWFVRVNNKTDKIVKQGDGRGFRDYSYGCGATGKWYRFLKLPTLFKSYLRELPVQDEENRFAIIGHSWYLRNSRGQFTKIVSQGRKHTNDTLNVYAEDCNWYRIHNSLKNSKLKDYIFSLPTSNATSKVNTQMLESHDKYLIQIDGAWYFNNGSVKDQLVEQGDNRGQNFLIYCRGKSKAWYRFFAPPDEFKAYRSKLPRHLEKTSFFFDGKYWYILSKRDKGAYRKLLMQSMKHLSNVYFVYTEDKKWHRLRKDDLSRQVTKAILNLPLANNLTRTRYKNRMCDDGNLEEHNGTWFIRNENGLDCLINQGDGRGVRMFTYSRGESGRWYTFLHPPEEFKGFLSQLPTHFDASRFSFDGTSWHVLRKRVFKKLVQRGNICDNKTLFVADSDGGWHRIPNCNKSQHMLQDLLKLPLAIDRYHNFRLRRFRNNNHTWYIFNNKLMNVTAQGDIILYVHAGNNKWYKFKNPPNIFRQYVSHLKRALGVCNITLDE